MDNSNSTFRILGGLGGLGLGFRGETCRGLYRVLGGTYSGIYYKFSPGLEASPKNLCLKFISSGNM